MITKQGVVVKKSGSKTIKVSVNEYQSHPKYKKQYKVTKNFLVHDADEKAKVGDTVSVTQCRPTSKKKSWTLISID